MLRFFLTLPVVLAVPSVAAVYLFAYLVRPSDPSGLPPLGAASQCPPALPEMSRCGGDMSLTSKAAMATVRRVCTTLTPVGTRLDAMCVTLPAQR